MQRKDRWNEMTHSEAFELLPWIVNDTLSLGERAAVQRHVDNCLQCREEIDDQRNVRELVRQSSIVPLPTSLSFNRLLDRIDAAETAAARSLFASWHRPCLIAATLAIVSLSALLMLADIDDSELPGEFVTLTESGRRDSTSRTLHVIFRSAIPEADMRAVLLAAGGEIVRGPTAEGIYTIGIVEGSAASHDIDGLLHRLRKDPRVRLAERRYENVANDDE